MLPRAHTTRFVVVAFSQRVPVVVGPASPWALGARARQHGRPSGGPYGEHALARPADTAQHWHAGAPGALSRVAVVVAVVVVVVAMNT